MRNLRSKTLGAVLAACLGQVAYAQTGDIGQGMDVFAAECSECHSVRSGKNKKGPSLHAVVGRQSAAIADFKYSDAMRQSGWVWDAETLRPYLTRPKQALPGGKMKYDGLPDAKALEDLMAYLASLK